MAAWIFNLLEWLADLSWRALTGILDLGWRLLTALLDFGFRGVSSVAGMILRPFTQGADFLWDATTWTLGRAFVLILAVLLTACAVFFLVAAGENLYRKYQRNKSNRS